MKQLVLLTLLFTVAACTQVPDEKSVSVASEPNGGAVTESEVPTVDFAALFDVMLARASEGHAESQYNIGRAYHRGKIVQRDLPAALRWYHLAANQGYRDAQYMLGLLNETGQAGVLEDFIEAVRWYGAAGANGHAESQYRLGLMYERGEGVAPDVLEKLRWHSLAAKQGHGDAQLCLAKAYHAGTGVLPDMAQAVRWYEEASIQGIAEAQYKLGLLYFEGMTYRVIAARRRGCFSRPAKTDLPEPRRLTPCCSRTAPGLPGICRSRPSGFATQRTGAVPSPSTAWLSFTKRDAGYSWTTAKPSSGMSEPSSRDWGVPRTTSVSCTSMASALNRTLSRRRHCIGERLARESLRRR